MASSNDIESYVINSLRRIRDLIYTPQSVRIVNETKDKDVIIVLGNTRCGKSTIVNYTIGNNLVANRIRGKTFNIIKEDPNSPGPAIGVASTSKTTTPTAWSSSKLNGLIVDAPGFDDNRGEVQDIANSFYIKEIISNAKSVKLVFISDINDIIHDNIEQFIKFLDIIYRMFPDIERQNKGMVKIFTKDKEDLTIKDIRLLLKEKILDEVYIKLSNRDLVEYFYRNYNQIVNVRMPEKPGLIDEGEVFQNLNEVINRTQRFANYELSPIVPGISDKSRVFLLEAHKYMSELQEFEDVLQKVYIEFIKTLQRYTNSEAKQEDFDQLNRLREQITTIRNANKNKFEKLQDIRQLTPEVQELQDSSDLFVKLKFVSFIDEVLTIKESNIFDVKIDLLVSNMSSKINKTIAELQNRAEEISNDELSERLQQIGEENRRVREEQEREISRLQEENKRIVNDMKKRDMVDTIISGLALAAKLFFLR